MLRATLLLLCPLAACTQDAYEKGESERSRIQADFVEVHTDAERRIASANTDDGWQLTMQPPFTAEWAQQPDTFYRAVLYYDKVDGSGDIVAPVACSSVPVPPITPADSVKEMKTDPVQLESVWLSKSMRYLNAALWLKTGTADDSNAVHRLGVVNESLLTDEAGRRTLYLRLYHDQDGIPEYYSQRTYFSIPLYKLEADSIILTVGTYEGEVTKRFCINPSDNLPKTN